MSATRWLPASRSMQRFPVKPHGVERGEERLPVHLPLADGHLLAPRAGRLRPHRVLDVALPQPRRERAQRGHGIPLVVEDHVGRVEVHADVLAAERSQERREGVCLLLAGLERDGHLPRREEIRDLPEAGLERGERGVARLVGQETGVERHEAEAQPRRNLGVGLDVPPGLRPGGVGHDAAGAPDAVERRVVFPDRAEHPRHTGDTAARAQAGEVVPGPALVLADRVEGNLQSGETRCGELREKVAGGGRLQGPAAHRQS